MSYYPPGTIGTERALTGEWPCVGYTGDSEGCGSSQLNDASCCQRLSCWAPAPGNPPDHCPSCCPLGGEA